MLAPTDDTSTEVDQPFLIHVIKERTHLPKKKKNLPSAMGD
jgi:hypothetical protein